MATARAPSTADSFPSVPGREAPDTQADEAWASEPSPAARAAAAAETAG
jgi:hypothetical protein